MHGEGQNTRARLGAQFPPAADGIPCRCRSAARFVLRLRACRVLPQAV